MADGNQSGRQSERSLEDRASLLVANPLEARTRYSVVDRHS